MVWDFGHCELEFPQAGLNNRSRPVRFVKLEKGASDEM